MASQFITLEDAGANCHHLRARAPSRTNVLRCVTNEADGSILAESAPRLVHALAEDVHSHFAMIAKTAKAEKVSQASSLDLMPAHRFQISGSHAQQFSGRL